MESEIVYWLLGTPENRALRNLYGCITEQDYDFKTLGSLTGCYFPRFKVEMDECFDLLRAKGVDIATKIGWVAKVEDKQKFFLAKIKYGI